MRSARTASADRYADGTSTICAAMGAGHGSPVMSNRKDLFRGHHLLPANTALEPGPRANPAGRSTAPHPKRPAPAQPPKQPGPMRATAREESRRDEDVAQSGDGSDHGDRHLRSAVATRARAIPRGPGSARRRHRRCPDGKHAAEHPVGRVVFAAMMPTAPLAQTSRKAAASATPTAARYARCASSAPPARNVPPTPASIAPKTTKSPGSSSLSS